MRVRERETKRERQRDEERETERQRETYTPLLGVFYAESEGHCNVVNRKGLR